MGVTTNLARTGFNFQYVPTLRTKSGEVTALRWVQQQAKDRVVPILQVMPSVSATFAADMAAAWGGFPAILDGTAQTTASGSAAAFNSVFGSLGAAGIPVLPLVEFGGAPIYMAAVLAAQNQFAPGLALRVTLVDLPNASTWAAQHGLNPASIDLIIDCGHVAEIDPQLMAPVVTNALQTAASSLNGWRSLTLSASSAPKDASGLPTGTNVFPRRAWRLWSALAPTFPHLHFGDYGISHRDLSEPPGYAMANATVSPRYAVQNDWVLLKGVSTRGANGVPMATQYHGHAQTLSAATYFGGLLGCWADGQIAQIAARAGVGSSGNRGSWVGFGLNRHVSLVCAQLP
ncbi:beta family protein [Nitrobacter sp.]|uniref:beta family protein n=1 Tax=Nitrobacter sp. TaxID=29420 RepID=UPI0029CAAEF8|nr:hypothetical protein [Nitrobacter sp.]